MAIAPSISVRRSRAVTSAVIAVAAATRGCPRAMRAQRLVCPSSSCVAFSDRRKCPTHRHELAILAHHGQRVRSIRKVPRAGALSSERRYRWHGGSQPESMRGQRADYRVDRARLKGRAPHGVVRRAACLGDQQRGCVKKECREISRITLGRYARRR